jgi:hypothetical protein
MVRGRVTQHPLGLQGTWRSYVHHAERCDHELFEKVEAEFEKLDRDRAANVGHVHARDAVVFEFHTSARVRTRVHEIVSRQHQHAAIHKEREILQWKGKTKHIKAKFFFIKDIVDSGEIRVIDCPAEEMWADVLTKPLQGMAFRSMRAQLMNCAINYEDEEEKASPRLMPVRSSKSVTWKDTMHQSSQAPQECVGLNRQKHLPRPTTDRWLGIARIQSRAKVPKTGKRSKQ